MSENSDMHMEIIDCTIRNSYMNDVKTRNKYQSL